AGATPISSSGSPAPRPPSLPNAISAVPGKSSSAPAPPSPPPGSVIRRVAMGAINYGVRAAGMLVGELLPKEGRLAAALAQLPAAILIALVAPLLLHG